MLFTSPERAKSRVRDFPGYWAGPVTELSWVVGKLGIGCAVALNPAQPHGMDFEA